MSRAAFALVAKDAADLLIVLGGPIGAYETDTYPFLAAEIALLERRLMHDRPTLGICLGSQLMAKALGARVFPGPLKEIGWGRIDLTEAGAGSSLASLGSEDSEVLHWHGDTFDLPAGAVRLACNANYENQAFAFGQAALALQFHAEADPGSDPIHDLDPLHRAPAGHEGARERFIRETDREGIVDHASRGR